MMACLSLTGAVLSEVVATTSLRLAMRRRSWYVVVALAYIVAFVLLAATLALGMPLGIAYGTWAAVGVALVAILDRVVFKEPFSGLMAIGIVLIVGGVLCIELGATH